MKTSREKLTVIIPVYNEEDGIRRIIPAIEPYIQCSKFQVSVLFVNDGSSDGSLAVIKELCLLHTWVDFLSFGNNAGLSAALRAGFKEAKSKWVGYIDADLQTDPMDFLKLEYYVPDFDLVTGKRVNRQDSVSKKLTSSFANWFRDSMLHDGVHDSGCPLKIMNRKMALHMPYFKGMHRFFPALALLQGKKVKEVVVKHYPRITGKSKFNMWNRLVAPFTDTLAVRWMIRRSGSPQIPENSRILYKSVRHE